MSRTLWILVSLVLAGLVALVFIQPHRFVSPGNLIPAHAALQDDCFACHAPFRGASPARCIQCHTVAGIGLRTTKGVALKASSGPAFHQALIEPDCLACHSDHARPRLTRRPDVRFDHALLKDAARTRCESCHTAPRDDQHGARVMPCATCHQPPRWTPATFDHDRHFRLDDDHRTTCVTCHTGGNYKRYTCYGCHEHRPAQILADHRDEGIRNIDNCVRCHRSPDGETDDRGRRESDDDP